MNVLKRRALLLVLLVVCLFGLTMLGASAATYDTDANAVTAGAVARIGNEGGDGYYATIAEAITAAQDGDTIIILKDCVLDTAATLSGKAVTIKGTTKDVVLTGTAEIALTLSGDASLTIKDLTIVATDTFLKSSGSTNGNTLVLDNVAVTYTAASNTVAKNEGFVDVRSSKLAMTIKNSNVNEPTASSNFIYVYTNGSLTELSITDSTISGAIAKAANAKASIGSANAPVELRNVTKPSGTIFYAYGGPIYADIFGGEFNASLFYAADSSECTLVIRVNPTGDSTTTFNLANNGYIARTRPDAAGDSVSVSLRNVIATGTGSGQFFDAKDYGTATGNVNLTVTIENSTFSGFPMHNFPASATVTYTDDETAVAMGAPFRVGATEGGKWNTTYFETLSAAIAAVEDGGKASIYLLAPVSYTSMISFSNKHITLIGSGNVLGEKYDLTYTGADNNYGFKILSAGSLIFQDITVNSPKRPLIQYAGSTVAVGAQADRDIVIEFNSAYVVVTGSSVFIGSGGHHGNDANKKCDSVTVTIDENSTVKYTAASTNSYKADGSLNAAADIYFIAFNHNTHPTVTANIHGNVEFASTGAKVRYVYFVRSNNPSSTHVTVSETASIKVDIQSAITEGGATYFTSAVGGTTATNQLNLCVDAITDDNGALTIDGMNLFVVYYGSDLFTVNFTSTKKMNAITAADVANLMVKKKNGADFTPAFEACVSNDNGCAYYATFAEAFAAAADGDTIYVLRDITESNVCTITNKKISIIGFGETKPTLTLKGAPAFKLDENAHLVLKDITVKITNAFAQIISKNADSTIQIDLEANALVDIVNYTSTGYFLDIMKGTSAAPITPGKLIVNVKALSEIRCVSDGTTTSGGTQGLFQFRASGEHNAPVKAGSSINVDGTIRYSLQYSAAGYAPIFMMGHNTLTLNINDGANVELTHKNATASTWGAIVLYEANGLAVNVGKATLKTSEKVAVIGLNGAGFGSAKITFDGTIFDSANSYLVSDYIASAGSTNATPITFKNVDLGSLKLGENNALTKATLLNVSFKDDASAVANRATVRLGDTEGKGYYTTLTEALTAAENGDTIYVLKNLDVTPKTVISGKTLTIAGVNADIELTLAGQYDADGKPVNLNTHMFEINNGANVTFKNIKAFADRFVVFRATDTTTLTLDSGAHVSNVDLATDNDILIYADSNTGSIVININEGASAIVKSLSEVTPKYGAVYVGMGTDFTINIRGTLKNLAKAAAGTTAKVIEIKGKDTKYIVNVYEGAVLEGTSDNATWSGDYVGIIYFPSNGTKANELNIMGGTFTVHGQTGVAYTGPKTAINISGNAVINNTDAKYPMFWGSGKLTVTGTDAAKPVINTPAALFNSGITASAANVFTDEEYKTLAKTLGFIVLLDSNNTAYNTIAGARAAWAAEDTFYLLNDFTSNNNFSATQMANRKLTITSYGDAKYKWTTNFGASTVFFTLYSNSHLVLDNIIMDIDSRFIRFENGPKIGGVAVPTTGFMKLDITGGTEIYANADGDGNFIYYAPGEDCVLTVNIDEGTLIQRYGTNNKESGNVFNFNNNCAPGSVVNIKGTISDISVYTGTVTRTCALFNNGGAPNLTFNVYDSAKFEANATKTESAAVLKVTRFASVGPINFENDKAATYLGYVFRLSATEGGTLYYNSLEKAIAAAKTGDTIYVVGDVDVTATTTLSDKEITLTTLEGVTVTNESEVFFLSLANNSTLNLSNFNYKGNLFASFDNAASTTAKVILKSGTVIEGGDPTIKRTEALPDGVTTVAKQNFTRPIFFGGANADGATIVTVEAGASLVRPDTYKIAGTEVEISSYVFYFKGGSGSFELNLYGTVKNVTTIEEGAKIAGYDPNATLLYSNFVGGTTINVYSGAHLEATSNSDQHSRNYQGVFYFAGNGSNSATVNLLGGTVISHGQNPFIYFNAKYSNLNISGNTNFSMPDATQGIARYATASGNSLSIDLSEGAIISMNCALSTWKQNRPAVQFDSDASAISLGYVARLGAEGTATYYESVPAAISAAAANDTIYVFTNVSLGSAVTLTKAITISSVDDAVLTLNKIITIGNGGNLTLSSLNFKWTAANPLKVLGGGVLTFTGTKTAPTVGSGSSVHFVNPQPAADTTATVNMTGYVDITTNYKIINTYQGEVLGTLILNIEGDAGTNSVKLTGTSSSAINMQGGENSKFVYSIKNAEINATTCFYVSSLNTTAADAMQITMENTKLSCNGVAEFTDSNHGDLKLAVSGGSITTKNAFSDAITNGTAVEVTVANTAVSCAKGFGGVEPFMTATYANDAAAAASGFGVRLTETANGTYYTFGSAFETALKNSEATIYIVGDLKTAVTAALDSVKVTVIGVKNSDGKYPTVNFTGAVKELNAANTTVAAGAPFYIVKDAELTVENLTFTSTQFFVETHGNCSSDGGWSVGKMYLTFTNVNVTTAADILHGYRGTAFTDAKITITGDAEQRSEWKTTGTSSYFYDYGDSLSTGNGVKKVTLDVSNVNITAALMHIRWNTQMTGEFKNVNISNPEGGTLDMMRSYNTGSKYTLTFEDCVIDAGNKAIIIRGDYSNTYNITAINTTFKNNGTKALFTSEQETLNLTMTGGTLSTNGKNRLFYIETNTRNTSFNLNLNGVEFNCTEFYNSKNGISAPFKATLTNVKNVGAKAAPLVLNAASGSYLKIVNSPDANLTLSLTNMPYLTEAENAVAYYVDLSTAIADIPAGGEGTIYVRENATSAEVLTITGKKVIIDSYGDTKYTLTMNGQPNFKLSDNSHLVINNVKIVSAIEFANITASAGTYAKLDLESGAEIVITADNGKGLFIWVGSNGAVATMNLKQGSSVELMTKGTKVTESTGLFRFASADYRFAAGSTLTIDGTIKYGLTLTNRSPIIKVNQTNLAITFSKNADIQLLHTFVDGATGGSTWNAIVCLDTTGANTKVIFDGGKYTTVAGTCLLGLNGQGYSGTYEIKNGADLSGVASGYLISDYALAGAGNVNTTTITFKDVDLGSLKLGERDKLPNAKLINVKFASDAIAAANHAVRVDGLENYYTLPEAVAAAPENGTIYIVGDTEFFRSTKITGKTITIMGLTGNEVVTKRDEFDGTSYATIDAYLFEVGSNTHVTFKNITLKSVHIIDIIANESGASVTITLDEGVLFEGLPNVSTYYSAEGKYEGGLISKRAANVDTVININEGAIMRIPATEIKNNPLIHSTSGATFTVNMYGTLENLATVAEGANAQIASIKGQNTKYIFNIYDGAVIEGTSDSVAYSGDYAGIIYFPSNGTKANELNVMGGTVTVHGRSGFAYLGPKTAVTISGNAVINNTEAEYGMFFGNGNTVTITGTDTVKPTFNTPAKLLGKTNLVAYAYNAFTAEEYKTIAKSLGFVVLLDSSKTACTAFDKPIRDMIKNGPAEEIMYLLQDLTAATYFYGSAYNDDGSLDYTGVLFNKKLTITSYGDAVYTMTATRNATPLFYIEKNTHLIIDDVIMNISGRFMRFESSSGKHETDEDGFMKVDFTGKTEIHALPNSDVNFIYYSAPFVLTMNIGEDVIIQREGDSDGKEGHLFNLTGNGFADGSVINIKGTISDVTNYTGTGTRGGNMFSVPHTNVTINIYNTAKIEVAATKTEDAAKINITRFSTTGNVSFKNFADDVDLDALATSYGLALRLGDAADANAIYASASNFVRLLETVPDGGSATFKFLAQVTSANIVVSNKHLTFIGKDSTVTDLAATSSANADLYFNGSSGYVFGLKNQATITFQNMAVYARRPLFQILAPDSGFATADRNIKIQFINSSASAGGSSSVFLTTTGTYNSFEFSADATSKLMFVPNSSSTSSMLNIGVGASTKVTINLDCAIEVTDRHTPTAESAARRVRIVVASTTAPIALNIGETARISFTCTEAQAVADHALVESGANANVTMNVAAAALTNAQGGSSLGDMYLYYANATGVPMLRITAPDTTFESMMDELVVKVDTAEASPVSVRMFNGTSYEYYTLYDAIEVAPSGSTLTVFRSASINGDLATISGKTLIIEGLTGNEIITKGGEINADGTYGKIDGYLIKLGSNADVTFKNITLKSARIIRITANTKGAAVTITLDDGALFEATPNRVLWAYDDNGTTKYSDAAMIFKSSANVDVTINVMAGATMLVPEVETINNPLIRVDAGKTTTLNVYGKLLNLASVAAGSSAQVYVVKGGANDATLNIYEGAVIEGTSDSVTYKGNYAGIVYYSAGNLNKINVYGGTITIHGRSGFAYLGSAATVNILGNATIKNTEATYAMFFGVEYTVNVRVLATFNTPELLCDGRGTLYVYTNRFSIEQLQAIGATIYSETAKIYTNRFDQAMSWIPEGGNGTLQILGTVSVDSDVAIHNRNVTIIGLDFDGDYHLKTSQQFIIYSKGSITFQDLRISASAQLVAYNANKKVPGEKADKDVFVNFINTDVVANGSMASLVGSMNHYAEKNGGCGEQADSATVNIDKDSTIDFTTSATSDVFFISFNHNSHKLVYANIDGKININVTGKTTENAFYLVRSNNPGTTQINISETAKVNVTLHESRIESGKSYITSCTGGNATTNKLTVHLDAISDENGLTLDGLRLYAGYTAACIFEVHIIAKDTTKQDLITALETTAPADNLHKPIAFLAEANGVYHYTNTPTAALANVGDGGTVYVLQNVTVSGATLHNKTATLKGAVDGIVITNSSTTAFITLTGNATLNVENLKYVGNRFVCFNNGADTRATLNLGDKAYIEGGDPNMGATSSNAQHQIIYSGGISGHIVVNVGAGATVIRPDTYTLDGVDVTGSKLLYFTSAASVTVNVYGKLLNQTKIPEGVAGNTQIYYSAGTNTKADFNVFEGAEIEGAAWATTYKGQYSGLFYFSVQGNITITGGTITAYGPNPLNYTGYNADNQIGGGFVKISGNTTINVPDLAYGLFYMQKPGSEITLDGENIVLNINGMPLYHASTTPFITATGTFKSDAAAAAAGLGARIGANVYTNKLTAADIAGATTITLLNNPTAGLNNIVYILEGLVIDGKSLTITSAKIGEGNVTLQNSPLTTIAHLFTLKNGATLTIDGVDLKNAASTIDRQVETAGTIIAVDENAINGVLPAKVTVNLIDVTVNAPNSIAFYFGGDSVIEMSIVGGSYTAGGIFALGYYAGESATGAGDGTDVIANVKLDLTVTGTESQHVTFKKTKSGDTYGFIFINSKADPYKPAMTPVVLSNKDDVCVKLSHVDINATGNGIYMRGNSAITLDYTCGAMQASGQIISSQTAGAWYANFTDVDFTGTSTSYIIRPYGAAGAGSFINFNGGSFTSTRTSASNFILNFNNDIDVTFNGTVFNAATAASLFGSSSATNLTISAKDCEFNVKGAIVSTKNPSPLECNGIYVADDATALTLGLYFRTTVNGETRYFPSIAGAVVYADNGSVVYILGNSVEGGSDIKLDKFLMFESVGAPEGEKYTITHTGTGNLFYISTGLENNPVRFVMNNIKFISTTASGSIFAIGGNAYAEIVLTNCDVTSSKGGIILTEGNGVAHVDINDGEYTVHHPFRITEQSAIKLNVYNTATIVSTGAGNDGTIIYVSNNRGEEGATVITMKDVEMYNTTASGHGIYAMGTSKVDMNLENVILKVQGWAMSSQTSTHWRVNMTNVDITSTGNAATRLYGAAGSYINIVGGKFSSSAAASRFTSSNGYAVANFGNSITVNFYDGLIESSVAPCIAGLSAGVTINIYGGSFNYTGSTENAAPIANPGRCNFNIYGGHFTNVSRMGPVFSNVTNAADSLTLNSYHAFGNANLITNLGLGTPSANHSGYGQSTLNTIVTTRGATPVLLEGTAGLGFRATIDNATYNYLRGLASEQQLRYGMLIIPTDKLPENVAFTHYGLAHSGLTLGEDYFDIEASEADIQLVDGNVVVTIAYTDIADFNTAYSVVFYANMDNDFMIGFDEAGTPVYKKNNLYHYSAYSKSENSRSLAQVARAAYNDATQSYTDAERAILATLCDGDTAMKELDIFIMAGGSNAAGNTVYNNNFADNFDQNSISSNVLYSGLITDYTSQTYGQQILHFTASKYSAIGTVPALGLGWNEGTMGVEIGMAQKLSEYYNSTTGKYAAIMKYAVNGANLVDILEGNDVHVGNWISPSGKSETPAGETSGQLYTNFIQMISDQIADYKAMGYKVNVVGMYWMQGEDDVAYADKYDAAFSALVSDVRADLSTITGTDLSTMPVVVGEIANFLGLTTSEKHSDFVAVQNGFAPKYNESGELISGIANVIVDATSKYIADDNGIFITPAELSATGARVIAAMLANGNNSLDSEISDDIVVPEIENTTEILMPDGTPVLDIYGNPVGFTSIVMAAAKAPAGCTIKLTADQTIFTQMTLLNLNGITLDGNGKTITVNAGESGLNLQNSNVTLKNFKLVYNGSDAAIKIDATSNLVIEGDSYIEASTTAIELVGTSGKLEIKGGTFKTTDDTANSAIIRTSSAHIEVTGGTFEAAVGSSCIYIDKNAPAKLTVNIKDGSFKTTDIETPATTSDGMIIPGEMIVTKVPAFVNESPLAILVVDPTVVVDASILMSNVGIGAHPNH